MRISPKYCLNTEILVCISMRPVYLSRNSKFSACNQKGIPKCIKGIGKRAYVLSRISTLECSVRFQMFTLFFFINLIFRYGYINYDNKYTTSLVQQNLSILI